MNDKKKIERIVGLIDAYDDSGVTDSSNEMRNLIEDIKKTLEK